MAEFDFSDIPAASTVKEKPAPSADFDFSTIPAATPAKAPPRAPTVSSVVAERKAGVPHEAPKIEYIVDPTTGFTYSSDPVENRRLLQRQIEDQKGLASGVVQSLLGTAQLGTRAAGIVAPETAAKLGDYEAEYQRYLKSIGTPEAQAGGRVMGEIGQFIAGGEALAATKLGKLVPSISRILGFTRDAEEAAAVAEAATGEAATAKTAVTAAQTKKADSAIKALAKGVAEAPLSAAKGAATGTGIGVTSAAIAPRTEKTEKQRDEARWKEVWENIPNPENWLPASALVGAGLGFAGGAGKTVVKAWSQMKIAEQKAALEAAKEQLQKQTGQISEMVTATRDVEEAKEKAAQEAVTRGLSQEEADAFVAQAEARVTEANKIAEDIVKEFNAIPASSRIEFGAFAQEYLQKARDAAKKALDEEVGFDAALNSAPQGDVVDLKPVIDYIDTILPDFKVDTGTSLMLRKLRNSFVKKLSPEEAAQQESMSLKEAAEDLFKAKEGTVEPAEKYDYSDISDMVEGEKISVKNANNIRKEMNEINSAKELSALTYPKPATEDTVYFLNQVVKRLNEAAGEAHPPYMEAVRKFRSLSKENMDVYDLGTFKNILTENPITENYEMLSGDVTRALLKMARSGNPEVAAAIRKDPIFQEEAKKYLVGELFGPTQLTKRTKLDQNAFTTFFKNNESLVKEAGLLDYFKGLQDKFEKGQLDLKTVQEELKTTQEKTGEKVATTEQAASDLAKAQEAQKQLGIMQTEIRTASQEKDFDRQAKDAENWILKIYDKYNAMSEKDYNALIDETSRIKQDYNNAKIDLETAQKRRNIVLSRAVQFLAAYLGSATGIGWTTYHYMGADKRGGGE